MQIKKVLIFGAGRYYISCIQAAREAGYITIAIDRDPNAAGASYAHYFEPVDFSDVTATLKVARQYRIDGVVPLNDYGVRTAAIISQELMLPGIDLMTAQRATDKEDMRKCWVERGVPSPPFRAVFNKVELQKAIKEIGFPLIFKPADSRGGGSRGVSIVESEKDVAAGFDYARLFYEDPRVVVERCVSGIEHSAETVTYEGKTHILAISDKIKTPPPYRVDKKVLYPTALEGKRLKQLKTTIIHAVQSLGIKTGPAHVELCSTENGPILFELGARCGGGGTPTPIMPYISGVEMFKEVVRIAVGDKPHVLEPKWNRGCSYHFLTPLPGRLKEVRNMEKAKHSEGVLDMEVFVKTGDTIPVVRYGWNRSGFIIAGGQNRTEALLNGNRAEAVLKFVYHSS